MAKKDAASEKAAPAWLLEDFKNDAPRSRQKPKALPKRPVAASPTTKAPKQPKNSPVVSVDEVHQADAIVTSTPAADVKAPAITVDADRGGVRKAWGIYRSHSMSVAICAFARTGLPEETIQAMMGLTNTQFHNWMASDPNFARDYMTCRATWENAAMSRIAEIADAKLDWKAWACLLEKNNPNRWGANASPASSVEVPSEGSVPVNLDPAYTTARLEELVIKAKAALVAQGHDPEAMQPITIESTTASDDDDHKP